MNPNFDFKVDRAGDGVHNKSVSPACWNHYSSSLSRMEEVFDCLDEQVAVFAVGRKRPRNDSARTTAKRARHSGDDKEPVIACQHVAQSFCNAALLTPDDLAANHRCMYSTSDKVTQDQFLTSLMSVSTASRPRVKDADRKKERLYTVNYFVGLVDATKRVPVCKQTFCTIYGE